MGFSEQFAFAALVAAVGVTLITCGALLHQDIVLAAGLVAVGNATGLPMTPPKLPLVGK